MCKVFYSTFPFLELSSDLATSDPQGRDATSYSHVLLQMSLVVTDITQYFSQFKD
jgi:hypothetical protein